MNQSIIKEIGKDIEKYENTRKTSKFHEIRFIKKQLRRNDVRFENDGSNFLLI